MSISTRAISCHGIGKSYGHYHVLHHVNLTIGEGECFVLSGANGAGKTTLLNILATLERPSAGHYEILGMHGLKEKNSIRAHLTLLAHGTHLYEDLNAKENVAFALALRGHAPTDRDVKLTFDRVRVGAFADVKVRYFSAGMKKRLALAKAMLTRPRILLLDEPFTALDAAGIALMREYILERLAENGTVLMSTHDWHNARAVAHRAGVLRQGTLQERALEDLSSDDLV